LRGDFGDLESGFLGFTGKSKIAHVFELIKTEFSSGGVNCIIKSIIPICLASRPKAGSSFRRTITNRRIRRTRVQNFTSAQKKEKMASIEDVMAQVKGGATALDASGMKRSVADMTALAMVLKGNKTLTNLELYDCEISDEGLQVLVNVLKDSSLTELSLGWNAITNKGVMALASKMKESGLRELYLGGNAVMDAGVTAIASVLNGHPLMILDLGECQVSDSGCIALANALLGSSISELSLGLNSITDKGCIAIAEAMKNSSLAVLDLSFCHITDFGASALASKVNTAPLRELRLTGNEISDSACFAFALALKDSSLKELYLDSNPDVTDNGARALASAAKECPTIQIVDLEGNEKVRRETDLDLYDVLQSHTVTSH